VTKRPLNIDKIRKASETRRNLIQIQKPGRWEKLV
jgi:hypothetical protein